MGPHEPIAGGYTAGHPERSDATQDRPTLPYRGMADDEVVSEARKVYAALQEAVRWANERESLLVAWGAVCAEMNIRHLTDDVTTPHADEPDDDRV